MKTYNSTLSKKTLFQLCEYHKLNLLNEKFKVISPHEFDMGNIGLIHLQGDYDAYLQNIIKWFYTDYSCMLFVQRLCSKKTTMVSKPTWI